MRNGENIKTLEESLEALGLGKKGASELHEESKEFVFTNTSGLYYGNKNNGSDWVRDIKNAYVASTDREVKEIKDMYPGVSVRNLADPDPKAELSLMLKRIGKAGRRAEEAVLRELIFDNWDIDWSVVAEVMVKHMPELRSKYFGEK